MKVKVLNLPKLKLFSSNEPKHESGSILCPMCFTDLTVFGTQTKTLFHAGRFKVCFQN